MSRPLPDAADRRLAATTFDRNLVVVAGAGTGKTSLLVERFLNQALSGHAPAEGIAAITFTEKAAAEMKNRIAEALGEIVTATAAGGAAPRRRDAAASLEWVREASGLLPEELHRRAAAMLDALDAAFIGTIHAFASDLLRRYPVAAGVPAAFSVDAGLAQELLFDELWGDFLAEELGADPPHEALWTGILAGFGEGGAAAVARALTASPAACDHLARNGYILLDERAVYGGDASRHRETLAGFLARSASDDFAGQVTTAIRLLDAFLAGGTAGMRRAETEGPDLASFWKKTDSYSPGKKKIDGKEAMKEEVKAALALLRDLRVSAEDAFAPLFAALAPFAVRFRERILREGVLTFDDLLVLARNLLRDHPEVRERERARIPVVLVDEFQDTDPLQYEILFLLAGPGGGSPPDPYAVVLDPGRLFIVGDPKQSIYRFRGADMAAFVRALDRVRGDAPAASLTANFRSVEEILGPLNRLFGSWMSPATPQDREVEPEYEEIQAFRGKGGGGPRIELWSVDGAGATTREQRPAEAAAIARELASLIRAGTPPRAIAILFRALGDLPTYARALRDADVDFVVDGGKAFSQRPEVVEALALLQAAGNPGDPVALLGALRSSWGGVPDAQLVAYTREGGTFRRDRLAAAQAARFPELASALERLRDLEDARRTLPLDRWIRRVLTEGDVPLLAAAHTDGPQRTANLRKLADRAAQLTLERGLSLEATVATLEEEFNGDRLEGESPLADEALDAVRVMSIHKAKGLEFDVVVLPDIGRSFQVGAGGTRVRLVRAGGSAAVAVELRDPAPSVNTAAIVAARDDARHEEAERKRLLYVAATRAKNRLIVVNAKTGRAGPWLKVLADAWDYDVKNWPRDGAGLAGGDVRHRRLSPEPSRSPRRAPREASAAAAAAAFARAAARGRGERPSRWRNPSRDHRMDLESGADGDGASVSSVLVRDLARAAGVAVHRLLEGWDPKDPGGIAAGIAGEAARAAVEFGLPPAGVDAEVRAITGGFLASPLPRYLAGVEILGREIPVLRRDHAGATVFGYVDLLYRVGGGIRVADYKTDADDSPAAASRYLDQLEDYAAAVRDAFGLGALPAMEILFVRTGTRVPLVPGGSR